MKIRFWWLLSAALVVTGCGSKVTQVIVTIDAETAVRAASTRLHLVVLGGLGRTTGPTASRFERVLTPGVSDPAYPFTLALAPLDGDVGRSYNVTATALAGPGTTTGTFIGEARIIGGYVEGETQYVRLTLEDACRGVACGDEQTCKAGVCVGARASGVVDAGVSDAGHSDGGGLDGGASDLGAPDLGGRCAPLPTGDVRWAQYPLPGTPDHPRSYQLVTAGTDETVIDCVTGLEWQRSIDSGTYTQANAATYCAWLTLATHSDWRLPSTIELMTLVDYSVLTPSPTIDAMAFPGTPSEWFWSAYSTVGTPSFGGLVSFDNVSPFGSPPASARARCVRGNDTMSSASGAPPGHFTDLGDGTVRDNLTGLVWQQGTNRGAHSEFAMFCSALTVSGGGGWRPPSILELRSIVDESVSSPSIDATYFPGTSPNAYWSSSYVGRPSSFMWWLVDFNSGTVRSTIDNTLYWRCVR